LTISRSWIDFCCWHDQTRQWWKSCEALWSMILYLLACSCNENSGTTGDVIRYCVHSFHNARVKLSSMHLFYSIGAWYQSFIFRDCFVAGYRCVSAEGRPLRIGWHTELSKTQLPS
jgi:hypothetical protein